MLATGSQMGGFKLDRRSLQELLTPGFSRSQMLNHIRSSHGWIMFVGQISEIRLRLGWRFVLKTHDLIHRRRAPVVGKTDRSQAFNCVLEFTRTYPKRFELRPEKRRVLRTCMSSKASQCG